MTEISEAVPSITTEMHCYVVNLPRRPDRRHWITNQLPDELPVSFTSDWGDSFDGRLLDHDRLGVAGYTLFPWRIESNNPWWSQPMKYGQIGCALAHLACWRDALTSAARYIVVLEDDVVIPHTFVTELTDVLSRLERRASFDLLYLGRCPLAPDRAVFPADMCGVVEPGYSHCTHGYLLTREALHAVLDADFESAIMPVDEFLAALYVPHPRADVRRRFPPRLRALALKPPLVSQRPKNLAGSDTEESEFVPEPRDSGDGR